MKYNLKNFNVIEEVNGWQMGYFSTPDSVNHLAARNTETSELCILYPRFFDEKPSHLVPVCVDAEGNRSRNKKTDYEKILTLPDEVKQAFVDHHAYFGGDKKFQELAEDLFESNPFKTPVRIETQGQTWDVTANYSRITDGEKGGHISYLAEAIRVDKKLDKRFLLIPTVRDGVVAEARPTNGLKLDQLPCAVQGALADMFCELAQRYSQPVDEDLHAKISGTWAETSEQLARIAKEVKDAKRTKLSLVYPPKPFFDITVDGDPPHVWTIDSQLAFSNASPGIVFQPTITDETDNKRFILKRWETDSATARSGMSNIIIEQTEPQKRPLTLEEFGDAVPAGVRHTVMKEYDRLLKKTGEALSDRVKRVLTDKNLAQLEAENPNWTDRLIEEIEKYNGHGNEAGRGGA